MRRIAGLRSRRRKRSVLDFFALARTRTGVLALTTVGNLSVRTVSSVLLTRLLSPNDFGIVGIIGSIFYGVTMITDLGFQAFLIRHQRSEEIHFRDVIWTIHAKRGLALCVTVAATAPLMAMMLSKPMIALPLAVASIFFLISGLASMSLVTALRYDKSRELSLLDFMLQVFQTVACVLLALWWRNAWAMIVAMLLQTSLRSILSYRLFDDSSHRWARDESIFREFISFSRLVLMSSTLTLLIGQSDKIVLARIFSLHDYGLYAIALSITSAPSGFVDSYVSRIVFPLYAQGWRQTPSELPNLYYKVRQLPSRLYAFGTGMLIGGAPLLVALLYDARYGRASTFISYLMISVALRLPNLTAMELLTATGDMKQLVRVNVVRLVWLALAIPSGFICLGPIGVVAAVGLLEVPAMLYTWLLLNRVNILNIRHELSFLAMIAAGAVIARFCAAEALPVFGAL